MRGLYLIASRCGKSAFTLVEVLLALVITGIALVPLIRLHTISIIMQDRAASLSRATSLAEAKMAEILAVEFPEVGTSSGHFELEGPVTFSWRAEVSEVKNELLEELGSSPIRRVSVKVHWDAGNNRRDVTIIRYASAQSFSYGTDEVTVERPAAGTPPGKGRPPATQRSR